MDSRDTVEQLLGGLLRIYFASLFSVDFYRDQLRSFQQLATAMLRWTHRSPFDVLDDCILPPLDDHAAFIDLFRQTRLFVSDHFNLVDMDVFNAVMLGGDRAWEQATQ